jgi:hypothetical protein
MLKIIDIIQDKLRVKYNTKEKERLIKLQALKFRKLQYFIYRLFFGHNLKALSKLYYTDKWGAHKYATHYQSYFSKLKNKKLNLLEIGIGGYEDPEMGGGSLRVWRTYFYRSCIYGIDIYDKSVHEEKRIKTFKGSQVDEKFLSKVVKNIGGIDIIIDDGSHVNDHVIFSFKYLFPILDDNGLYIIEDTQTSYWNHAGGTSENFNSKSTIMGFFKSLVDGLNYEELEIENYEANYYERNIVSIHFYHNLIFIQKGLNNEGSNLVVNGKI